MFLLGAVGMAVLVTGVAGGALDMSGQDSDLDCLKRDPAWRADDETNDISPFVQILTLLGSSHQFLAPKELSHLWNPLVKKMSFWNLRNRGLSWWANVAVCDIC